MVFVEKIKTKIKGYYNSLKTRLAASEAYKIILPVFFACLLLLILIPYLFNNSALQFQIEQRVSAALKANLEIEGKVSVALLPSPSITINEAFLQNYVNDGENYSFYAKKITIKLSFLSSLMGEFAVDKIIFSQAILQNYSNDEKPVGMSDTLTEIIAKKATSPAIKTGNNSGISGKLFVDLFKIDKLDLANFNSANLPKIFIEKSTWVAYDKLSNKRELGAINAQAFFSKKKVIAEGSFSNQEIINNFHLSAKFRQKYDENSENNSSVLELTSPYGNFKISGVFPEENLGFLKSKFRGKLEAEIFDLKNFYKSYVARDGLIYNKINPTNKSIKLKASIVSEAEQILINNIFINSNIINGRGDIEIDLTSKLPLIDIKMGLENVDLDAIWLSDKEVAIAAENKAATPETTEVETGDNSNNITIETKKEENDLVLNLAKDIRDFDLTAELTISRVKYLNEEIKNVNLYTTISKEGEILILPLTLEVPGGGIFRMSGALENHTIPKFIGSLDASGTKLADIFKWLHIESQNLIYANLKNYNLYADIMLIPNSTSLNNVYLNINDGKSEILGEIHIQYTTKTSSIFSNFHVNNLVIDDYFFTSGQNIYLSPGSLIKKLLWLNDFSSNNNLSLSFDRLVYKNSTFDDQSVKMRFGQGYLEIRELKLNSDKINLAASLAVDISGTSPKFDITIRAKSFDYQSLQNTPDSSIDKSVLIDDKYPATNDGKPSSEQTSKISALDQFYALPSLEGFKGNISINLDSAYFDDFLAENIKISGKLKDGIIDFDNFTADIYGGNLTYKGVASIKFDKALSGNAVLTEIKLQPLLYDLMGIKNINATSNITASIESLASSRTEFFKNLNSSIKFSNAGVTIEKYGLNDLIKKMFNPKNYVDDLRDPEKILFNPSAITTLKQATGTATIEKGRDNAFKIDFETVAANGIFSGNIDFVRNSIDGLANIIFLTGNLKKQIPLNIATNLKGDFNSIAQSSNLDQVKQYLKLPDAPPIEASAPINAATPSAQPSSTAATAPFDQIPAAATNNTFLPPQQQPDAANSMPQDASSQAIYTPNKQ
ncbi:MAG: AsmA family protein [Rickettsiales bacterium]|nr:AsmA family protein [Rickettsiales bacterium]